jgi:hypothetical protein
VGKRALGALTGASSEAPPANGGALGAFDGSPSSASGKRGRKARWKAPLRACGRGDAHIGAGRRLRRALPSDNDLLHQRRAGQLHGFKDLGVTFEGRGGEEVACGV